MLSGGASLGATAGGDWRHGRVGRELDRWCPVQLGALVAWLSVTTLTPTSAMAVGAAGSLATAVMMQVMLARRAGVAALRPRWSRELGDRLVAAALGLHPGIDRAAVGKPHRFAYCRRVRDNAFHGTLLVGSDASRFCVPCDTDAKHGCAPQANARRTHSGAALHRHVYKAGTCSRDHHMSRRVGCRLPIHYCRLRLGLARKRLAVHNPRRSSGRDGPGGVRPPNARSRRSTNADLAGSIRRSGVERGSDDRVGWPPRITGAALGSVAAFWLYGFMMVVLLARASQLRVGDLVSLPRRGEPLPEFVGGAARRLRMRFSGACG